MFDRTVTIERKDADTPIQEFKPLAGSWRMNIQPADDSATVALILSGDEFARAYTGFAPKSCPVQGGDRVICGAKSYIVRAVTDQTDGPLPCKICLMLKE